MNDKKNFLKRESKRKLSAYPEYNYLNLASGASIIIACVALGSSYNMKESTFHPVALMVGLLFMVTAFMAFLVSVKVKSDIDKTGGISNATRRIGYVMIIFALCGNIFVSIAGFTLIKKEKTIEYTLSFYSILVTVFIILVSMLNIFKESAANSFFMGIGILTVLTVFYITTLFLVQKFTIEKGDYRKLIPLAFILIATSVSGNIFALILGLVILSKVKNLGKNKKVEWVETLRRIFRNNMSSIGLFFIIFLLTLSFTSILTFDYAVAVENNYGVLKLSPSLMYPFGTDDYGRCVFTRIIFGGRISLTIGMISTGLPIIIGCPLGALAGHYGKAYDNVIMRSLDILYAVPSLLLAIAIIAAFGANLVNMILALSIGSIPIYARTMRAQVMIVSNNEFVEAARANGLREWQIILKHIMPNALAPIIVRASLSIGAAVLSTSSLSYLGLGVEPHIPEWGNILKTGSEFLETQPYLAIFPGLAIVLLVLSFNYFGDGLRDALDPKLK